MTELSVQPSRSSHYDNEILLSQYKLIGRGATYFRDAFKVRAKTLYVELVKQKPGLKLMQLQECFAQSLGFANFYALGQSYINLSKSLAPYDVPKARYWLLCHAHELGWATPLIVLTYSVGILPTAPAAHIELVEKLAKVLGAKLDIPAEKVQSSMLAAWTKFHSWSAYMESAGDPVTKYIGYEFDSRTRIGLFSLREDHAVLNSFFKDPIPPGVDNLQVTQIFEHALSMVDSYPGYVPAYVTVLEILSNYPTMREFRTNLVEEILQGAWESFFEMHALLEEPALIELHVGAGNQLFGRMLHGILQLLLRIKSPPLLALNFLHAAYVNMLSTDVLMVAKAPMLMMLGRQTDGAVSDGLEHLRVRGLEYEYYFWGGLHAICYRGATVEGLAMVLTAMAHFPELANHIGHRHIVSGGRAPVDEIDLGVMRTGLEVLFYAFEFEPELAEWLAALLSAPGFADEINAENERLWSNYTPKASLIRTLKTWATPLAERIAPSLPFPTVWEWDDSDTY